MLRAALLRGVCCVLSVGSVVVMVGWVVGWLVGWVVDRPLPLLLFL